MFKSKPKISVRDQMLVLTLPDAVTPALWQLDLAATRTSVIEVIEQNGQYVLRFKNAGTGVAQDIAVYATRAGAVDVMMRVHEVLAGRYGWGRILGRLGYMIGALLLLWVLLNIVAFLAMSSGQDGVVSQPSIGVPQSADDVLLNRGS